MQTVNHVKAIDVALDLLRPAPWNPNAMTDLKLQKLKTSVIRFGIVGCMVVRSLTDGTYEVLSDNHMLKVCQALGRKAAPCVVVDLDDAEAMLLAQALNQLHGEDDLGVKAELVRTVLAEFPESQVVAVLPETAESLHALTTLGQEDLAAHLRAWQQAQSAKLKNLQFRLTLGQLETVHEALDRIMPR